MTALFKVIYGLSAFSGHRAAIESLAKANGGHVDSKYGVVRVQNQESLVKLRYQSLLRGIGCVASVESEPEPIAIRSAVMGQLHCTSQGATRDPLFATLENTPQDVRSCVSCGLGGVWRMRIVAMPEARKLKGPFLAGYLHPMHVLHRDIADEIAGAYGTTSSFQVVLDRSGRETQWAQPVPQAHMIPLSPESQGVRYWDLAVCECGRRPWYPARDEICQLRYSRQGQHAVQQFPLVSMFEPCAQAPPEHDRHSAEGIALGHPGVLYTSKAIQILLKYAQTKNEFGRRTYIEPCYS